jgi:hypothetical protein
MQFFRPASATPFATLLPLALLAASALATPGCADLGGGPGDGPSDFDTDDDGAYDDGIGEDVEAIAVPGNWKPSQAAINAGMQQFVAYDSPPPWDGGAHCSGQLFAATKELGDFIDKNFSGMSTYGGYNCRQNTGNLSETSVHGTGRALDLMIPTTGGQADNTKGDPIANWLISNAQALGVQYIIWDHVSWGASRSGTKLKTYTGPNPHVDHIHVELSNEAGAGQNKVFGKVNTSGANLTVRSGPSTSFASVGSVADNASVTIRCRKAGQSISGSTGTTSLWDNINSGFVSQAFVVIPAGSLIAACP